jgi:hypothetical protein
MWKSWNQPSLLYSKKLGDCGASLESRDLIIDELNDRVAVFERTKSCSGQPSTTAKEMNDGAQDPKLMGDSPVHRRKWSGAPKRSNHSLPRIKTKVDLSARNLDQVVDDPTEEII